MKSNTWLAIMFVSYCKISLTILSGKGILANLFSCLTKYMIFIPEESPKDGIQSYVLLCIVLHSRCSQ